MILVLDLHCKTASEKESREVRVKESDDDLASACDRAVSFEVVADAHDPKWLVKVAYLKMMNKVRTIQRPRRKRRGKRVTAPM